MTDHAQIAIGLKRVFARKGRPANEDESRPVPATVGELLRLLDGRTCDHRARRRRAIRITEHDIDAAFRQPGLTPRSRTGGPLIPLEHPRWSPPRENDLEDWRKAALWALGACQWLRGKGAEVDMSWPIVLQGPPCEYRRDRAIWHCRLTRAMDETFEKITGDNWFSLVMADPCNMDGGLIELADCQAYMETYNLEMMEEANPPLVLLNELACCWKRRDRDTIDLSGQEALFGALAGHRLSLEAAHQVLKHWAHSGDEWALPACWRSALWGVLAFTKFTDGPWAYDGDPESCGCGYVSSYPDNPGEYFGFIERLSGARRKLEDACREMIAGAQKHNEKFWKEFARSIYADIENHPEWKIKQEKDRSLAGVFAEEQAETENAAAAT